MEQVDGSRMKAAFQLLQCLGRLRLILGVIVQVCKAPEYAFVIAVVDNGQGLLAEDPGRKAEQMHFVVEILLHICVELRDLPLLLFHGLGRQSVSRMGDAVGAHSVPLVDHALDQIRILLDIGGGHKKYGLDIFFLQDIQNIGGSAVFIALVKGQVDFIAVRDNEIGIVFAVFFLVGQGGAGPVLLVAVCAGPSGEVSREARSMGVLVMVWEVLIGSGPDASPSVAGWVPVPLSGVAPLLPDCPGILPEKEIAGREEVRALGETKTPLAAETLPPAEVWEAAMEEDWRPGRI